jgi:DNA-binding NarL/FixJ family response regulator
LESTECPLSPSLLRVVQCAASEGTCSRKLAQALFLSEETVNTYWKLIKRALQIDDRHQAVVLARQNGWLDIPV